MSTSNISETSTRLDDEVEWNLIGVLRKIVRGRRILLICALIGLTLGVILACIWPQWYAAQAVFLPPRSSEMMSMGGAGASMSASSLMLQQDPSDMYLGMLTSRTVADDVIDHVGLMAVYHAKKRVDARSALTGQSKFKVNKNSLISVDVTAKTPELAARIANAYLDALYRLNGAMAASASAHREAFFEQQVEAQRAALDTSEMALKQAEEKTGVLLPQGEAQATLMATADLQAAIGNAEATLSGVRVGATEDNPRVIQARAQLASLRAQLARQQADSAKHGLQAGLASSGALPGVTMELTQKMRQVKLNETLYDSLTQQYERSRIAAIDPGPQFQIVDRAIVPERKAGPPRKLIVLGCIFLAFTFGLMWVLLYEPARQLIRACLSDPTVPIGR